MNAFHVCGGMLAVWAVIVSFLGITRENFPATTAPPDWSGAISLVLVVAAIGTAIYTAATEEDEGGEAMLSAARLSHDRSTTGTRSTTPRWRGTPVYSSDEVEVGKVVEVLDNYREHIFDGLVVADRRTASAASWTRPRWPAPPSAR